MVKPIKGKVMTDAEEVRELRNWLREDAANHHREIDKLHRKLDQFNSDNQKEHKDLHRSISEIQTVGAVNKTKIVGLVSLVSLIVSAIVGRAVSYLSV